MALNRRQRGSSQVSWFLFGRVRREEKPGGCVSGSGPREAWGGGVRTGQEPLLWSEGHRAPLHLSAGGREGRTVSCTCPGVIHRLETI